MAIVLPPAWQSLTFMSPLSEQRATRLVDFLVAASPRTVLDIGCGWAELLLRTVAAAPTTHGTGIDLDAGAIERARSVAGERGLTDRITLTCGDVRAQPLEALDALVCIGASQVWGPPVEAGQPLDYSSALTALRGLARPGARVVYGEGIWSRPPTPAAAAPLAGRLDEFVTLPRLVELAVCHGFMPVSVQEASLDEWDWFESAHAAGYARWLASHGPDHADADEVRRLAARQRAAYFEGYRGILGMAYLELLAV